MEFREGLDEHRALGFTLALGVHFGNGNGIDVGDGVSKYPSSVGQVKLR